MRKEHRHKAAVALSEPYCLLHKLCADLFVVAVFAPGRIGYDGIKMERRLVLPEKVDPALNVRADHLELAAKHRGHMASTASWLPNRLNSRSTKLISQCGNVR